jgi:uncharacterized membrane protein YhaH (DUF805 family)
MGFGEAISSGFSNYVTFSGRASRSEYWFWTLFATLVSGAAGIIDAGIAASTGYSPFSTIVSVALFLPGLAVSARRLHDLDRTAWWLLILLTIIGAILLLVWDCMKGTDGPNRFGPDPLAGRF